MSKQVIIDWVAALRSGQYQQGEQQLRHGDKFCCLGVLRDICPMIESHDNKYLTEESNAQFLKPFGLDQCPLSRMNDSEVTFLEIADYIERKVNESDN